MKRLLLVLLFLNSIVSSAQFAPCVNNEHHDSLINGLLYKHDCKYNNDCYTTCEYNIAVAKKRLITNPNSVIFINTSTPDEENPQYCYINELLSLCKKMNIDVQDEAGICGSEFCFRQCYYAYFRKEITGKYFKGIEDSLHKKAAKMYLKRSPNKPFYTIFRNFKKVMSVKGIGNYALLDTVFISKKLLDLKEKYNASAIWYSGVDLFVSISGKITIKSSFQGFDTSFLTKAQKDKLTYLIVKSASARIISRPAQFYGLNVPTKETIYFTIMNSD